MEEVDMQRMLNHSNMKEEHLHCRFDFHGTKEDGMQRKYDLHESEIFHLHCRLHTLIPIAIDMQCADYSPTAMEPYMHCI